MRSDGFELATYVGISYNTAETRALPIEPRVLSMGNPPSPQALPRVPINFEISDDIRFVLSTLDLLFW